MLAAVNSATALAALEAELEEFSPPPVAAPPRRRRARLRDLGAFSRRFVRDLIASRTRVDCADLAIAIWIHFAARHRLPVQFRIWMSRERRYRTFRQTGFRTTAAFVRYIQSNLGAAGLISNTFEVPGGHRAAVPGDVYLWRYYHARTNRVHRWGHTQIIDRVIRGPGGPETDTIAIVQGSLPAIVPVFQRRPATYFSQDRRATIGGEPHIGRVVGRAPRRFNSFRQLR
jgi:hypothetical protein